jgi:pilus assembly protein Flp/PilA
MGGKEAAPAWGVALRLLVRTAGGFVSRLEFWSPKPTNAADESGATAIQYGLIAAGISLVIIAAVNGIGTKFDNINTSLKWASHSPSQGGELNSICRHPAKETWSGFSLVAYFEFASGLIRPLPRVEPWRGLSRHIPAGKFAGPAHLIRNAASDHIPQAF